MLGRLRTRRVSSLVDKVGGLVRRWTQREQHSVDLELAAKRQTLCPGALSRYTPELSCYRSVSQRQLATHAKFLSAQVNGDWGDLGGGPVQSLLEKLLTDPALGAIIPPAGQDSLRFWDNDGGDRGQVAGMVLIGVRAKVSAQLVFEERPLAPFSGHVNAGQVVETFKDYVRDYVSVAIFHTGDDFVATGTIVPRPLGLGEALGDPWVGFTPLRYYDRPSGDFSPVPPLLWRRSSHNPNARIMVDQGEFGTGSNPDYNNQRVPILNSATPTGSTNPAQNFKATLSIILEGLFVPSPEDCEGTWPGELCPTHKIGLHPDYRPELPSYNPPADDLEPAPIPAAKSDCHNCKVNHDQVPTPSPFGILDPRHNVRRCVKELLNLEDHIFVPGEWCNDCVHKHSLKIESLGEEGVSLDTGGTEAGQLCRQAADIGRQGWRRIKDGEDRARVGDDLRKFRKQLAKKVREWEDAERD